MDIIFSANNNEEIKIIPVIPQDLPQVDKSYSSSSINTLYGELNLIGVKGLRSLTLESFFPSRRYPFMRPGSTTDYSSYIRFFEKWADEKAHQDSHNRYKQRNTEYGCHGTKFYLAGDEKPGRILSSRA